MGATTKIEWADATWGPVTGCDSVSSGCLNCYARDLAERFRGVEGHYFEQGFDLTLRPQMLDRPLTWREPKKVFVNSLSDLGHGKIPRPYLAEVFAVMAMTRHHTFQVLTKRAGVLRSVLSSQTFPDQVYAAMTARGFAGERDELEWPLPNLWLGVSVEDQAAADLRIPILLRTPAALRFLSCEPLLGPVSLHRYLPNGWGEGCLHNPTSAPPSRWELPTVDWVIAGGESGKDARPMHPEWARVLRDQCEASKVPFTFKQWGAHAPYGHGTPTTKGQHGPLVLVPLDGSTATPIRGRGRGRRAALAEAADGLMAKYGKTRAGRTLDGRIWDEAPTDRQQGEWR